MNWELEMKEVKGLTLWIILGTILVVNSRFASSEYLGSNDIGQMIMLNMTLLGWFLIGWGILSFTLNTATLIMSSSKKTIAEE